MGTIIHLLITVYQSTTHMTTRDVCFFDTHSHLNSTQFDDDRSLVLMRMKAQGVAKFCEIGYDVPSSQRAIQLAHTTPNCWAVVGVQPNHPEAADDPTWLDQLHELAQQPRVVAIGEIGFDHYHRKAPVAVQETLFRSQIALANTLKLPIVIHTRDAHADTLRVLRDVRHAYGVVMHSFAGDMAYAEACLDLGCMLSLSGPITFRNNQQMHEVVRTLPLDRLLIETDSPYLAPHPHRGTRNEPTYVPLIAHQIANLHQLPINDVASALWHNAHVCFDLEETHDTPTHT